ncbi:winged helix-turn-helix domain-containing protein [Chloroflexota bacterium]
MPIPDQTVIVDALIDELEVMGGSAEPQELIDRLADRFDLTDDEREEVSQSGRRAFDHRVYQAAYMARAKRGMLESLKRSGRGLWVLKDKAKTKRKKAPPPKPAETKAERPAERPLPLYKRTYERPVERTVEKPRDSIRSKLDYFNSLFREEKEKTVFEPSKELQSEMSALRSTLENAIVQLERVGEYLVREVQVIRQEASEGPAEDMELVAGVGDIGALFAQQVDKVRNTIRSTMGLPVLRPGLLTAYIELLVKSA